MSARRLPDDRGSRRAPRSVRWRLGLLSFFMSSLILAISGIGLVALDYQRGEAERSTLIVEPAFDVNRSVRMTMIEAQSSLRGFIAYERARTSGGRGNAVTYEEVVDILAPYKEAEERIDGEERQLSQLLTSQGFAHSEQTRNRAYSAEQAQRAAVSRWWQFARSVRESPRLDARELHQGQKLFGDFEEANTQLAVVISAEREDLRRSLRETILWASLAVVGATVLALGLAVMMGWRTTSAMTKPLQRLRDIVRRQRHGDRDAGAATDIGAAEVRELASDVNALTAAHHELTDRQRASLDILRAQSDLVRSLQSSDDLGAALRRVVDGIGEGLKAERVVAGMLNDKGSFDDAVVWTAPKVGAGMDNPWSLRKELAELAERLWGGERQLVIDDVSTLPEVNPDDDWWGDLRGPTGTGGLLAVPFGLGEKVIGIVSVRSSEPRSWMDNETAFVHHVVGEVTRLVVKATSERQRAEHVARLEELDRQKDDFMSTISHELRTPLTSISGYLEMLADGDAGELTSPQRQMLEVVGRNAVRLRGLIEDLLVLNRLEASGLPSDAPVFSVCEVVYTVAEELAPVAGRAGVSLHHEEQDGSWVRGDQVQLARALANLASNAVKFTPAGGRVRLSCRPSQDGSQVEVRCIDTGMGIPADETEHLFTRFFRASNASRAQIQGTGLGLVIVRNIVERHGGTMELTSVEGQGTTVKMILPMASDGPACSVHHGKGGGRTYSPFHSSRS